MPASRADVARLAGVAGETAYGAMLHDVLGPRNIHVGQLIIPGAIGGDPLYAPEALADRL